MESTLSLIIVIILGLYLAKKFRLFETAENLGGLLVDSVEVGTKRGDDKLEQLEVEGRIDHAKQMDKLKVKASKYAGKHATKKDIMNILKGNSTAE